MFKVECFCEDKKLADVLRALAGIAYDVKPIPVTNARHLNGTIVPRVEGKGIDVVYDAMKQSGQKTFTAKQFKQILSTLGRAPSGYSHYARELIKAHRLKAKKVGNNYHWTLVEETAK